MRLLYAISTCASARDQTKYAFEAFLNMPLKAPFCEREVRHRDLRVPWVFDRRLQASLEQSSMRVDAIRKPAVEFKNKSTTLCASG
jgi:hypothetical protein